MQPGGARLVDRFRLADSFRTARMYTGGEPAYDSNRVFGVTKPGTRLMLTDRRTTGYEDLVGPPT